MAATGGPFSALDAITVMVVADHPLYREGLVLALAELGQRVEIVAADSVDGALRARPSRNPLNMVLLDGSLRNMDSLRAIGLFTSQLPGVPVLIVSESERPEDARRALQSGAAGYVPKSAPTRTLVEAVRLVLGGGTYTPPFLAQARAPQGEAGSEGLTVRQLEVLTRLGEGKSNKDIARALEMAEKTVKVHVGTIFKVLGVANRTQAVLEARRRGLISSG